MTGPNGARYCAFEFWKAAVGHAEAVQGACRMEPEDCPAVAQALGNGAAAQPNTRACNDLIEQQNRELAREARSYPAGWWPTTAWDPEPRPGMPDVVSVQVHGVFASTGPPGVVDAIASSTVLYAGRHWVLIWPF
jgi:hypothetical protein